MDDRGRETLPGELRTVSSAASQVSATHNGDDSSPHAGARHAHRRRYEIPALLHDSLMRYRLQFALAVFVFVARFVGGSQTLDPAHPRIIELSADKDSRYRQARKVAPTIEVTAGEPLILRITASRAEQVARDGSVHGLALLDKNSKAVPGWRFFLHPGVQEVSVTAPLQPGRYTAVCTVICSDAHEGMNFTLVVTEPGKKDKE